MKICFAINNLQAGGAERVFSSLVNWFVGNTSHSIYALFFLYPCAISDFYHLDARIHVYFSFFKDIDDATEVLSKIRPDCVISFLNPMNYIISKASRKLGIVHIACERNNPYYSPQKEIDRMNRDEAFYYAAGCVFQTTHAASYFDAYTKAKPVTIIENPICIQKQINLVKKENRIVTIGRYANQKNYPILLHAFYLFRLSHPEYKLDCYGKDSGQLQTIKRMAYTNNWDKGVFFHEPTESIHEEIVSAKIFIMTSKYEGMPNALAEAAALGLPCVAVDVPGVRELINRYHCGVLCPTHKPEMIATTMETIIQNMKLYTLLSENGNKILESIGIDRIAPQWVSFIEEVVDHMTYAV